MQLREDPPAYEAAERGATLAEQVYQQLSSAVLSGTFAPLERINIRRLADEMGVSVTPAREAILRLIAEEVLQITPKGAITVPERSEAEVEEIFDIRRLLEGKMAEAAAPRLSGEDVSYLQSTQERFLHALAVEDYKAVLHCNSAFHFHIYRRAEQPVGLRIVESLWLRIGPTLRHMYPYLHRNRGNHRRHEDIINAAQSRNPDTLRDAIIADLATSREALGRYVRDNSLQPPGPAKRRLA